MSYRPIKSYDWLVVHCAATPADMDIGVKEIRHWHLQRGFSDVGYHYIIRRDGTVEKGRTDTTPGAHARGYNMHSLGICMVGGSKKNSTLAEDNFTQPQFKSLQKLLTDLKVSHPDAEILGHRDLPGVTKACPSFDVREWLLYYAPELVELAVTIKELNHEDHTRTTTPKPTSPNTRDKANQGRGRRRGGRTYRL